MPYLASNDVGGGREVVENPGSIFVVWTKKVELLYVRVLTDSYL